MEQNNVNNTPGTGYIIVKVSTARGAIPLQDAAVSIRGSTPEDSDVMYSVRTQQDGLTEKLALPAPALYLSQTPEPTTPYSLWNIDVFKEGYIPIFFQNIPVYTSVVSIQPAVMVPLPEQFSSPEIYNESETPNL